MGFILFHFFFFFFKRGVGTKLFPGDCCGWLTNVSHLFFVVFYIEGTFFPFFKLLSFNVSLSSHFQVNSL